MRGDGHLRSKFGVGELEQDPFVFAMVEPGPQGAPLEDRVPAVEANLDRAVVRPTLRNDFARIVRVALRRFRREAERLVHPQLVNRARVRRARRRDR